MAIDLTALLLQQKTLPTLLPDDIAKTMDDIGIYQSVGHRMVEILMRTPRAVEAIRAARQAYPEMVIGAGTVLTTDQVEQASEAGAQFMVSPAIDPVVAAAVKSHGLPFIPGVCTPTDVAVSLREGFSLQKLFPTHLPAMEKLLPESTEYYEALASPFGHTPLKLIAGYGVTKENFAACSSHRLIAGIIAGWLYKVHGNALRRELDETRALARPRAA